jgi:hypothetical protein
MGAFEANFGTAIDGAEVEVALLAALRKWIGPPGFTYLAWAKHEKDPTDAIWAPKPTGSGEPWESLGIGEIRSYSVTHFANEKWPEDQLPMFLAYSRGLAEPPASQGDGTVTGRFLVVLTSISSGQTMGDAKALARLYATAARGALMQHPGLASDAYPDGFGGPELDQGGIVWADHSNFEISRGVDAERSLMGVSDTYLVPVGNLLNFNAGVQEPFATPADVPPMPTVVKEGGAIAEVTGEPGDVVASLREHGFFNEGE